MKQRTTAQNDIQVMVESIFTETEWVNGIECIKVLGSDSQIYSDLVKYASTNDEEKEYLEDLKNAIKAEIRPFNVPVCDPSISKNGKLQFVAGCKPAVGYSYYELEKLASNNGLQLGSKEQYVLFLATMINRLMAEGWSKEDAVYAICKDSTKLGHYTNSAESKEEFELTGLRKTAGKFDLGNTYKVLAKDKEAGGFWLAGGVYDLYGNDYPLANLELDDCYDFRGNFGVGWFVIVY